MLNPKYVFKIVTYQPDLSAAKLQLTELDEKSGFIHLSIGQQIPYTCDRFFATENAIYIIKFPYAILQGNMKWEPAPEGEELFPHFYGDLLTADVDSTHQFNKGNHSWVDVLRNEAWLSDK